MYKFLKLDLSTNINCAVPTYEFIYKTLQEFVDKVSLQTKRFFTKILI